MTGEEVDFMARAGLCTIADKNRTLREMIDVAAAAGAGGVEVWGQPDHVAYPVDAKELREARKYAAGAGIEICALGSYYRPPAAVVYHDVAVTARNQLEIAHHQKCTSVGE